MEGISGLGVEVGHEGGEGGDAGADLQLPGDTGGGGVIGTPWCGRDKAQLYLLMVCTRPPYDNYSRLLHKTTKLHPLNILGLRPLKGHTCVL